MKRVVRWKRNEAVVGVWHWWEWVLGELEVRMGVCEGEGAQPWSPRGKRTLSDPPAPVSQWVTGILSRAGLGYHPGGV